jgi:hypothetical protein
MMKSFRLTVSSLAVAALTLGVITGIGVVPASAATVTSTINNIAYTAESTDVGAGATVTSYSGVGGAVVIPDVVRISGVYYNVRTIGDSAFSNHELTAVTIGQGILNIGDGAFAGNRLTSVTIPDGVADIGSAAFANNALLATVVLTGRPPTVTAADPNSGSFGAADGKTIYWTYSDFYVGPTWVGYATAVEPVPVTDTINNITYSARTLRPGEGATVMSYSGAGGAVTMPDRVNISGVDYDVTTIDDNYVGDGVFAGKGLTSVKLPAKVTYIGPSAFRSNLLGAVIIPAGVTVIRSFAFQDNDLTTVGIPNGLAEIGDFAFSDNQLTSVALPDSLHTLDNWAFKYNRLTSVAIPGSVRTVGGEAFAYNWLTSVTFGSGVAEISIGAFEGNRLTSVTIPASVNTIKSNAFNRNPLTSALFMGPAPTVTTSGRNGPFGKPTGKTLYYLAANAAGFTSPWNGYTTAVVKAFTTAPSPTITGTKASGSTLTAVTGTWNPSVGVTFSYVWSRAATSGGAKIPISGATSKTYKLVTADKNKYITVTVTASKVGYQDTAKTSAAGGTKIAR